MAGLADRAKAELEKVRRSTAVRDLAQQFNDPLVWAVLPQLHGLLAGSEGGAAASPAVIADARNAARALSRHRGPTLVRVGPVLLVSTSGQNLRVLEPIASALELNHGPRSTASLPPLRARRYFEIRRQASIITRKLGHLLAERRCRLPAGMYEEIVQTAMLVARSELLMAEEPPELLVVGTQHNSATRAMLWAAHATAAVRTVYVPHAPVANNSQYRDLPVHYALLRGPAETDFYTALGASPDRLTVVGNPSISHVSHAFPSSEGPVVFCAPPVQKVELAAIIHVVNEADIGPVEVAPHPRMDVAALRALCPPTWAFNPARSTFERLKAVGGAAVVQCSSGVGLEALALGRPVVDLVHPGEEPAYPYLTNPLVTSAHNSEELQRAVAEADRSPAAATARQELAHLWCAHFGADAIRRVSCEIDGMLGRKPPICMILDGWDLPQRGDLC